MISVLAVTMQNFNSYVFIFFLRESQQVLSDCFRIAQSTISGIIGETCSAIVEVLIKDYLNFPSSAAEWLEISHGFSSVGTIPIVLEQWMGNIS